ncbi:uncharacterized protein IWZ02DRAFT_491847 [Phyllosticta citriasiana]|uniref:uncharacterized protein n=1 Tax=Phyllosticta citriasiana TaxID=595635 RepID=UPI0030FD4783
MPPPPKQPYTVGSPSQFDPEVFLSSWTADALLQENDLRSSVSKAFKLPPSDKYVYRAVAEVTLDQVQHAIGFGGKHGLHGWYVDEEGKQIPPPPDADIAAYTHVFSPSTSTVSALRALASNAKKDTLRAAVAAHLQSHLYLAPSSANPPITLTLPNKRKLPLPNPYYDYWAWSCHNLEWCGPVASTSQTKISHHMLPVFYHHFGCLVPTWDALSLIQQLAQHAPPQPKPKGWPGRGVLEIGSGNGYWALLLRRAGVSVTAVDNLHSEWRTMWIGDTVFADGIQYLKQNGGARDKILLLVYPQVGADFTGKVLRAYEGDYIVVAGTQNHNGFTGFQTETIAEWMAREKKEFERVAQVPLPSFAGKDEALFVFVRRREA